MVSNPPSRKTNGSNANPPEGSASFTSPTSVKGDTRNAKTTPPIAPAAPTIRVLTMFTSTSWFRETPSARNVAFASPSTEACRAKAWPRTMRPTRAARPARSHQPTAWGWIDRSIAAAWLSRLVTERPSSVFTRVWNSGKSAAP